MQWLDDLEDLVIAIVHSVERLRLGEGHRARTFDAPARDGTSRVRRPERLKSRDRSPTLPETQRAQARA